mmetsp:Transcript_13647/g.31431  ORF Transcript_13647/g.31431 Transcript_13647/m.31431 type:complete len:240 (-) Transcript_13647:283-1002(-)
MHEAVPPIRSQLQVKCGASIFSRTESKSLSSKSKCMFCMIFYQLMPERLTLRKGTLTHFLIVASNQIWQWLELRSSCAATMRVGVRINRAKNRIPLGHFNESMALLVRSSNLQSVLLQNIFEPKVEKPTSFLLSAITILEEKVTDPLFLLGERSGIIRRDHITGGCHTQTVVLRSRIQLERIIVVPLVELKQALHVRPGSFRPDVHLERSRCNRRIVQKSTVFAMNTISIPRPEVAQFG